MFEVAGLGPFLGAQRRSGDLSKHTADSSGGGCLAIAITVLEFEERWCRGGEKQKQWVAD